MRLLAAEPLVDAMRMKGVAAAEAPDARALEDGLEAERALEFLAHPRALWQLLERRLVGELGRGRERVLDLAFACDLP